MSQIANTLGLPALFAFESKEYKVAPRDVEIEGMISRRVQADALRYVQSMRNEFGPLEYKAQLDGLRHDGASRVYDYGGEICARFLSSEVGLKELMFLQLAKGNPSGEPPVTRDLIDRVWDDEVAFEALCIAMNQADSDPNRRKGTRTAP